MIYKFCKYYAFITLISFLSGILTILVTNYGKGNYCYLTNALIYGFECHNFIFSGIIQLILNWPLGLIYSIIFGLGAWPILLIALVLWLPILWYSFSLFNNRQLKKLALNSQSSTRKADELT